MQRTLKQKWSHERLFHHAGTLAGISTRLELVAKARSTLPSEGLALLQAAKLVRSVNVRRNRERSWEQFKGEKVYANS